MKRCFLFICLLVCYVPHVMAQGFFAALPDVPLLPGAVEIEERALSFDKPEGRIMIGVARVDDSITDSQVESYYQQSLPQFGWQAVDEFSYQRGHEKLSIELVNEDSDKILEITISP